MKYLSTVIFLFFTLFCYAQNSDTIPEINLKSKPDNQFRQLYVPSALIIGGLISEINFKKSLNFVLS